MLFRNVTHLKGPQPRCYVSICNIHLFSLLESYTSHESILCEAIGSESVFLISTHDFVHLAYNTFLPHIITIAYLLGMSLSRASSGK